MLNYNESSGSDTMGMMVLRENRNDQEDTAMSKEFTIENEYLKVTVTTWGAQVKSVIRKCDNVEHIWQADKSVWGYHAPILFPHAGKVVDGKIEAKGAVYESGQHGFARLMEHEFVEHTDDTIVLELCANEETYGKFPYEFRLVSTLTLENDTLHHTLTEESGRGEPALRHRLPPCLQRSL